MARTEAYVVIATRGRAREAAILLDRLAAQTRAPLQTLVIGTCADDIAGLAAHRLAVAGRAQLIVSPRAGLTAQRNYGLDWLVGHGFIGPRPCGVVVFFDDDFRPAHDWLEQCLEAFARRPQMVGLTGRILADGVVQGGLSESAAEEFLSGARAARPHWIDQRMNAPVSCLYGCNMAYAGDVAYKLRFDEALPLYGWQEDQDYSGQASRLGELRADGACAGVHLGVRSGRVSGLRFGYSQIANPLHIAARGNMSKVRASQLVCKALAANAVKSVTSRHLFDYPGRLRGNLTAIADIMRNKCDPARVTAL